MEYVLSFDLGILNLSVCALGIMPIQNKLPYGLTDAEFVKYLYVNQWEVINVLEDHSDMQTTKGACKDVSIDAAAVFLLQALERRRHSLLNHGNCIGVAIEQQPGGRFVNVRMKALSHVLQSFFYIHTHGSVPISFMSAKRKLKGMTPNTDTPVVGTNSAKANKYKDNKAFALNKTRALLSGVKNSADATAVFDSAKKKDDLADSFLQAIRYMYDRYVELKPPRKRKIANKIPEGTKKRVKQHIFVETKE